MTAWKDDDLLPGIREISPEARLENLIELAAEKGFFNLAQGESTEMPASEVQSILQQRDSPTSRQADNLLKYDALCERLLSTLAKEGCPFVTRIKIVNGTKRYEITRPRVE